MTLLRVSLLLVLVFIPHECESAEPRYSANLHSLNTNVALSNVTDEHNATIQHPMLLHTNGDKPAAVKYKALVNTSLQTSVRVSTSTKDEEQPGKSDENPGKRLWKDSVTLAVQSRVQLLTLNASTRPVVVCRVSDACTVGDGSVLLPHWMSSYRTHLEKCGLTRVRYILQKSSNASGIPIFETIGSKRSVKLIHDFQAFDFIGQTSPGEQQSEIVESLVPYTIALDVLKNPDQYKDALQTSCVAEGNHACNIDTVDVLNPMVAASSSVVSMKDTSWIKGYFRLIRNGLLGKMRLVGTTELYGWRIRRQAACFKSLVSVGANLSTLPEKLLKPSHFLYTENYLSREERGITPISVDTGCLVRVLILNGNGKRHMVGENALKSAITVEAKRLSSHYPYMRAQSEIVYFANSSFHEQVSIAQESNVVIAPHGEANTNVIFLRPGSALIEIMPFGYRAGLYDALSRIHDVQYYRFQAQPDHEVFVSCIKHFNPEGKEALRFLRTWTEESQKFQRNRDAEQGSQFVFDSAEDHRLGGIKEARQCMSFQRLSFDTQLLASRVISIGIRQCGYTQKRDSSA